MAGLGAMRATRESGLKVPEDIAVVGFSNWQFSSLIELSSVEQQGYEMGREAVRLMFAEIAKGDESSQSKISILDTEVIVRDSSKKKVS